MNTWVRMAEPVKQEKKPLRNKHKMGKCGVEGCANLKKVASTGHIHSYCKDHLNQRQRNYYARRKAELLAAGVESYSVLI
jgi:hypothetical protein